ncbi:MAG TPA: DUF1707 domain-containing protein [Solirubrobacteraceae bacterium]|jgi:hypothetical protein
MSVEEPQPTAVRASDEDRERLATALREHAVAGRITTDELEERLESTYAARTTAELEAVRRDLPVSPREAALHHAARRSQLTRRVIQEAGGSFALFVVCTAVWLASGAHGQFWPVWVLLLVVLSLVRNGWALFGPAADLDALEQQLDARRRHRGRHDDRRRRRRLDQ